MRRLSTPRKSTKIMHSSQLSYMVNNLLLGSNSYEDQCTFLSNSQIDVAVSTPPTPHPISNSSNSKKDNKEPKNKFIVGTSLTDFQFRSESVDRKCLRPQSSLIVSRSSRRNLDDGKEELQATPKSMRRLTSRQLMEEHLKDKKVEVRLVENETRYQKISTKPPQSIKSTKSIGSIKAYSVNSHKFFINQGQTSEGRILVIANLNKATRIQNIVSLFALFESNSSGIFADFLKDNFQEEIVKVLQDYAMPEISKELLEKCLMKIEEKFYSLYQIKPRVSRKGPIANTFGLSFALMFSTFDEIALFVKGNSRIVYSQGLGSKMQALNSTMLECRRMKREEIKTTDFILLLSKCESNIGEGVSLSCKNFQRQIWFHLMKILGSGDWQERTSEGRQMGTLIGSILDNFLHGLKSTVTAKNLSMILCGFSHLQQLLQEDEKEALGIPFSERKN